MVIHRVIRYCATIVTMGDFPVVIGAGTLRSTARQAINFPHRWTDDGVTAEVQFTGAHLLHLAAVGCVLNDIYREAKAIGFEIRGVTVSASGGYETDSWRSTGIEYTVRVDTAASSAEVAALLQRVDAVAEIPKAIRAGAPVNRHHE